MIPLWLGGVVPVDFIAALKIFWFGNVYALFGGHLVTDALVELAIGFILTWGITFGAIISLRRDKWISSLRTSVKLPVLTISLAPAAIFFAAGSGKRSRLSLS